MNQQAGCSAREDSSTLEISRKGVIVWLKTITSTASCSKGVALVTLNRTKISFETFHLHLQFIVGSTVATEEIQIIYHTEDSRSRTRAGFSKSGLEHTLSRKMDMDLTNDYRVWLDDHGLEFGCLGDGNSMTAVFELVQE